MSTDTEDLDVVDDEIVVEIPIEEPVAAAKIDLSKRRIIDAMLEERRLKKKLAEFDFDYDI